MAARDRLDECVGFDWDEANVQKNWDLHRVAPEQAEGVFLREPLIVRGATRHSSRREVRYVAMGTTRRGRRLFVVFAIRRNRIRVISARDMNGRESGAFGRYEKNQYEKEDDS